MLALSYISGYKSVSLKGACPFKAMMMIQYECPIMSDIFFKPLFNYIKRVLCISLESYGKLACSVCSTTTVLRPDFTCGKDCPVGFHHSLIKNQCVPCPTPKCSRCDQEEGRVCTQCYNMHEMDKSGACKSKCAVGTYAHPTEDKCLSCPKFCASCTGPNPDDCDECVNYTLYKGPKFKRSCHMSCPVGYFPFEKECVLCMSGCTKCNSLMECTACEFGRVLMDGKCAPRCKDGTFKDASGKCRPCNVIDPNCVACFPNSCLLCTDDRFVKNDTCVTDCGDGFIGVDGLCMTCPNDTCSEKALKLTVLSRDTDDIPDRARRDVSQVEAIETKVDKPVLQQIGLLVLIVALVFGSGFVVWKARIYAFRNGRRKLLQSMSPQEESKRIEWICKDNRRQ